jgi:hypothetical protein
MRPALLLLMRRLRVLDGPDGRAQRLRMATEEASHVTDLLEVLAYRDGPAQHQALALASLLAVTAEPEGLATALEALRAAPGLREALVEALLLPAGAGKASPEPYVLCARLAAGGPHVASLVAARLAQLTCAWLSGGPATPLPPAAGASSQPDQQPLLRLQMAAAVPGLAHLYAGSAGAQQVAWLLLGRTQKDRNAATGAMFIIFNMACHEDQGLAAQLAGVVPSNAPSGPSSSAVTGLAATPAAPAGSSGRRAAADTALAPSSLVHALVTYLTGDAKEQPEKEKAAQVLAYLSLRGAVADALQDPGESGAPRDAWGGESLDSQDAAGVEGEWEGRVGRRTPGRCGQKSAHAGSSNR